MFSDGCLAAILSDRFNIPFITSVRGTDINIFLKFKPFLRFELVEIMSKAKFIIAIAPWIRKIVKEKYTLKIILVSFDSQIKRIK